MRDSVRARALSRSPCWTIARTCDNQSGLESAARAGEKESMAITRLARKQSTKLAGVPFAICRQIVIARTKRHRWRVRHAWSPSSADDNVAGNRGKVTLVRGGQRPAGQERHCAVCLLRISVLEGFQASGAQWVVRVFPLTAVMASAAFFLVCRCWSRRGHYLDSF